MDKETFRKIKKKNLEKKYIQIKIVGVFTAIVVLVFLGTRIALNNKIELAKENIEEGEIKELGMEEATVELPKYKSTDIVPGRNVTFYGKNYAVNAKDVSKMIEGSYDGNEKYVFLTFDDGPSPITEQVLDILKNENVKGTFFMLGSRLDSGQASKDSLKRAIEEGNAIANHSYSHNFKKLYPGNITDVNYFMDEFRKTNDIMREILGVEFDTNVLRMPGGYNSRVYYKDR
ncbi:TPA: polysaccharide deacetylase family protein, partial [Clostridium perfringens]|nr:polysaccharide deacetylase family protein [Clostridium perfringens]